MISTLQQLVRQALRLGWRCAPLGPFGGCMALVAVLLLVSCASGETAVAGTTPTSLATPMATLRPSPTPATRGLPPPVLTPLAAPPQDCAHTAPPHTMTVAQLGANTNAQLVGGGAFWIYGGFYQNVVHLGQFGGDPHWPIDKVVVEVGPNYDQPVTLRLRELRTGTLAWWTDGQTPPGAATQTLTLDPQQDTESVGNIPGLPDIPHGEVSPGWREWGTFPMFSVAGCYVWEVSWSGGSWQSVIAVGN
jgi:hypothetical protein